jgi:aconitate hydratase
MQASHPNSYQSQQTLNVQGKTFQYFSLPQAAKAGLGDISRLPYSLKVILENLLRNEDGTTVTKDDVQAVATWLKDKHSDREIAYRPARVLMQDFTGVPAVVDLAAMRDAMKQAKGDPQKINPSSTVDLVIDHSVQVDYAGSNKAFTENVDLEMQRNRERYEFLRWGQGAFENFRVVPPGTGICHQVNLEYLSQVVWRKDVDGDTLLASDTLVGTDSHTTMVNALGVLGWGVGGIEAEAAMLGQPVTMLIPDVVGFRLEGQLNDGITATDLVLTVVQKLREQGVVGKFVEFYGEGLDALPLADRATISNMAPEYGATCGFFPVDQRTLDYLALTGRDEEQVALVKAYCEAQGLWRDANTAEPVFTASLSLNLSTIEPSLAGPKRPQDRVSLAGLEKAFESVMHENKKQDEMNQTFAFGDGTMQHGDLVIAAITSCTNTSNPSVLMAAGLVAKKAIEKGLQCKSWVKTSLAPGSQVVTDYLEKAGLQRYLDDLGFELVGYGCTTCIGNSGPLSDEVTKTVVDNDIVVASVLSGNRNFEGRIHPLVRANFLASPPLVVAYALAGTTRIDLSKEAVGTNKDGEPVYLKDIWPTHQEIADAVALLSAEMFRKRYADVFKGTEAWQKIQVDASETYHWDASSTYIQNPPYFVGMQRETTPVKDIHGAKLLALLGDSVTTDHISPAGVIKADSPAGQYLQEHGVAVKDFNSFGSRRGNHEVMMRGTFGNIRIRNEMAPGTEGGLTTYLPTNEVMPIFDASMKYQKDHTPLIVIAGKEYGTGSSRDWAAKGTLLLGVKAVITESFERIHRSNLIGMGILPLQFEEGVTRKTLNLEGNETFDLTGLEQGMTPGMKVSLKITRADGAVEEITVVSRIDTANELAYYENGGILQYVLRQMM